MISSTAVFSVEHFQSQPEVHQFLVLHLEVLPVPTGLDFVAPDQHRRVVVSEDLVEQSDENCQELGLPLLHRL